MNIFNAEEIHLKEIETLEKEIFSDPLSLKNLQEMFYNKNYQFLIYFDKKILGYLIISCVLDEIDIIHIAVSFNSRRKNIASMLLKKLVEYKKVFLEVRESNTEAIALYEKNGFLRVSLRKNYYENPKEHAILMTLEV